MYDIDIPEGYPRRVTTPYGEFRFVTPHEEAAFIVRCPHPACEVQGCTMARWEHCHRCLTAPQRQYAGGAA